VAIAFLTTQFWKNWNFHFLDYVALAAAMATVQLTEDLAPDLQELGSEVQPSFQGFAGHCVLQFPA